MPSRAPELELKFSAASEFSIAALASLAGIDGVVELPALNLTAVYYDTDDLRLARSGVTLRYRTGEEDGESWTIKIPGNGRRDEIRFREPAGGVPAEAQSLVTAFARGAGLLPVATLRTKRRRWSLRAVDGQELAELVDDRVSVLQGTKIKERFRELELEARTVDAGALTRIAGVLSDLGAVPSDFVPKAIRALGPRAFEPSDVPEPARVSSRAPVAQAVMAALATALKRLLINDPLARLNDVEGVHQMRVAARRLRGHLRTFSSLLEPEPLTAIVEELRWIARALGEARDLDVMIARVREDAVDLRPQIDPLVNLLGRRRTSAQKSLTADLTSSRYTDLLERLIRYVSAPPFTEQASEPCRSALPRLVKESWEPLVSAVSTLKEGAADEAYHEIRIHSKRARFAAEAAALCLGRQVSHEAFRFARHAEEVQNVLGARQDAVVIRQTLLQEAASRPDDGPFNLAAGRLIERQNRSIAACDKQFQEVWRALNRKKNREWLSR